MIPLLPGVLLALLPSLPGGQETAPEHESVEELLAALAEAEGDAPEVCWALLERDERSPEVIDALRHWLGRARAPNSQQVIDTILNHWRVSHEVEPFHWIYLERSYELVEPEDLLPREVAPLAGEDEELGERVAIELAAASSDDERMSLLQNLEQLRADRRCGAIDAALELADRNDEVGEKAREVILATYGVRPGAHLYYVTRREPITDPVVQGRLLEIARWLLDDRVEESPDVPDWDSLDLAAQCAIRSELAREVVVPRLIEILRETRKPRVLRLLCLLGVEDEFVRERYLETMSNEVVVAGGKIDLLPYWKHHDEETLAAFERVFSRADKLALVHHLVFAGLLDSSEHAIVRRFFEAMEEEPGDRWAHHRAWGFRHVAIPSPDEPKVMQANKLGLSIATRRARGEDYSGCASALAELLQSGYDRRGAGGWGDYYGYGFGHALALDLRGPEFVEAALILLKSERPFWSHVDHARELLSGAELTAEQAARAAALPVWSGGPMPVGLRGIPHMRQELYRGNTEWLDELCALTPLIPRDEEYLLVLLQRGRPGQRLRMLEVIRDEELDSPRIRAAVIERTRDRDHRVRELAEAIGAQRRQRTR